MPPLPATLADPIRRSDCLALVLSKPRRGVDERSLRVTVRPVTVGGRPAYQFARRADGKETHENHPPEEALHQVEALFGPVYEHCHVFTTEADYEARIAAGGRLKVRRKPPTKCSAPREHDRPRRRLIPENVPCPFLAEIGIMTPAGHVRASRYHKFRQINRFLELVDDVVPHLPTEGRLHVVDFGCGKSYLTFALHHLLAVLHGRDVQIVGLDRQESVIRDCTRVAERLGLTQVEFRVGDIAAHVSQTPVHLAVSLHACDTATDDALAKAVGWQADVILAVPCCQHELAPRVHNEVLAPLEQHGILKERFAALATDALRALALEICGYRTQVVEFIDLEHTAKNVLIRAIRRPSGSAPAQKLESYRRLKRALNLDRIHLEEALGAEFQDRLATVPDGRQEAGP